jgi:Uma2 family endonuclease
MSRYRRKLRRHFADPPRFQVFRTAVNLRYSEREFMATEIAKKLFTVYEYHKMVDAGILREGERVELIRGEIIRMSPINPPHNGTIHRAIQSLARIVGGDAILGVQGSIRLDEYDEPQPDLYLLRPREDFYTSRHAGPADILLIIEVSDSSLEYDRTTKMRLYVETGVPEYWISDLQNDCVITYSDAENAAYSAVRQFRRGETLSPRLLPSCVIPVDVLLP